MARTLLLHNSIKHREYGGPISLSLSLSLSLSVSVSVSLYSSIMNLCINSNIWQRQIGQSANVLIFIFAVEE